MRKFVKTGIAAGVAVLAATSSLSAAKAQFEPPDFMLMTKGAISKSVPLLQKSGSMWKDRLGGVCFSCHHQSLPMMAISVARERGLPYDQKLIKEQTDMVYSIVARGKDLMTAGLKDEAAAAKIDHLLVDPSIGLGYGLMALEADHFKPDAVTTATALYLANKQMESGAWPIFAARPPLEGSDFTCTAIAVREIQTYGPKDHKDEIDQRVVKARKWLVSTNPKTTEDKAFRLLGLKWAGADAQDIQKAAADLMQEQNDDGGWAQAHNLPSDAYATGQVLVALNQGASIPVMSPSYSKGTVYLLGSQDKDGSWHVKKRTIAFQPYFESGFPGEKDQFIGICGTSWATMALSLSLPAPAKTAAK
jgi:hypothetical protein